MTTNKPIGETMKSLYCEECGEYLMAGSGSLVDCSCGWKQPMDEGIDVAEYEALQAECEKLRKDAERYRWLRDGNGYYPEENYLRGGVELDDAIDAAMTITAKPAAEGRG